MRIFLDIIMDIEKRFMSYEQGIIFNQLEESGAIVLAADSLLDGWYWVDYDDGSGYLTNDITGNGIRLHYDIDEYGNFWFDRTSYDRFDDLQSFKDYVEEYVGYKYLKKHDKLRGNIGGKQK